MTRIGSVVQGSNGDLIRAIAPLYLTGSVADLTWGRGKWWTIYEPDNFTKWTGNYVTESPRWDQLFDTVTADPAYVSIGGRQSSTLKRIKENGRVDLFDRYGLDVASVGIKAVFADMTSCYRLAASYVRKGGYLLAKCQQQVESGRLHDTPTWVKRWTDDQLGLVLHDEIIHVRGLGPQPLVNIDGSPRVQQRAHRAHSHLLVFRKPS